jgi:predicted NodU family carbamoyl transferase
MQQSNACLQCALVAFLALLSAHSTVVLGWTVGQRHRSTVPGIPEVHRQCHRINTRTWSTPFEQDFYNAELTNDNNERPFLAVSPDTRLVIGLNKYSHDTSLCAADLDTGKVLFALSKERLTRTKADAGNVASLVETCLQSLDLELRNVVKVVMNNHHHRILPLEANVRQLEWEVGLGINGGVEAGLDEAENLLPSVTTSKMELSHHLAHAYSVAAQAPFELGLVVVMDGMGETYRTMRRAIEMGDEAYTSDLCFDPNSYEVIPSDIAKQAATSYFDWREAESVYVFTKSETALAIRPIFKRFTPERSPPTLYNHGFENMDSVGAVYSRASSHIFGDWNACGKVMGLAPWANYQWTDDSGRRLTPPRYDCPIMAGQLHSEERGKAFGIDRTLLEGMPYIARADPDLFTADGSVARRRYDFDDGTMVNDNNDDENAESQPAKATEQRLPTNVALEAIALSNRVQSDLENVVLDFVRHFQVKTGAPNLCLAGGVALNSVLNGRLSRELGFQRTFIPPYPGDDGIAIGCCAFGLFGNPYLPYLTPSQVPMWQQPLSPYLGPMPSESDMRAAMEQALPWLNVEAIRDDNQRLQIMASELERGSVIAWYQSRSEMGPRALGHRSILADPRKKGLVRFINENVKNRESFRPFAPSVLAEEAFNWFDLGGASPPDDNVSPYMSITALVRQDRRDRIPAVTHVDGSSRLQTVTKESEPLYHRLITKFFELTGIPMVLNTSFNTLPGEPIVETPSDAIRSFLCSMGAIEMLVMGDYVIRREPPDLRRLLGEASKEGEVVVEAATPIRAGPVSFQSSFDLDNEPLAADEEVQTTTRVTMPERPMHGNGNEWFEILDELEGEILSVCDGTATLNDIMGQYTATPEDEQVDMEANQNVLQNIVHRMVRLYEHTFISW